MAATCSWRTRLTRPVFLWWVVAWTTEVTVEWLFKRGELRSPARPFLAFLPVPLWIFFVMAFVRGVRRVDELQQQIYLQALSVAFGLTVALALLFAGLERTGIYRAAWSDVVSSLMFLWVIAYVFASWKYR
ncbi:MAG: hypothetical protein WA581_09585 [Candidatus Acidiferrales bacterium]